MSRPLKIALLGGLRAGKDTFTDMLKAQIKDREVCSLAFSTGIHNIIHQYFPEQYDLGKPREYLQRIGQFMRTLNPDVWINYLFNSYEYKQMIAQNKVIFITDVRQSNEVQALRHQGFIIIKIVADTEARIRRAEELGDHFDTTALQHETEIYAEECQDYDILVENNGTLKDLENLSLKVFKQITQGEINKWQTENTIH
ncbi:deoxynucleotide monophosphate kinase family protein [Rummeliibacillus stabekisii]|uniref:deoxynucleotide monophosphate kinase family protein n=1 Tax=Rummeliibacillus stabekisii TaxID=241244 RepID=UPI003718A3D2